MISLGFDLPYEPLINLLIDDGLQNRPNKLTILDNSIAYVGVSSIKNK